MSDEAKARVEEERLELLRRLGKLRAIIASPAFKALSAVQQNLLLVQEQQMNAYEYTLMARVTLWND